MRMRIFVITGAGVSAESGLGTFRDKDGTGIWARFDPMKLATPEAFARDPHEVYAFYNARRQNLIAAKPNVAHFALARLEMVLAERRGKLALVTQNALSAHPARSTPRPDLWLRRERSAFARARSIWSHPITSISLTRGGMDSRVRRFKLG
jgi:NAD-dependent deacetylase